ncbi:MAG: YncE family protein [Leeuwenhoekiella sp.]
MKNNMIVLGYILFATNFFCFGQNAQAEYKIVNNFHVDGDGGWDYLISDDSTGRLFISHSTKIQVINSKTGKLLGTIEDTRGVHGITLDTEANRAFISCGGDSSVMVIDLTTLKLIAKIKVTGENPDAILYDKFSEKVFVYNGLSSNATVIDAKTNLVLATIALAGKPEFSVSDGKGKVYVNIEDKSLITVIDSRSLKVENTWSLEPGEEPTGLSLDKEAHRLFAVCSNKKMVVMNSENDKIITTLDIGERSDGCAFDPVLKRVYSSNGEGTLTIVQEENENSFYVSNSIQTSKGARTICIDKKTHHIYLPTAKYGDAPEATAENLHPRPSIKPGTFTVLDITP